jgi:L-fuculose-phosphate aldolase
LDKKEMELREELSLTVKRVYDKGYTTPLNGNMSVRLDAKHILITPSYVCKGLVEAKDLLKVDFGGNVIGSGKKPSIETGMHLSIYKNRDDVYSVIHAHPKNVTTFAVANKEIDLTIIPEAVYLIGDIANIKYSMPGSEELRVSVEEKALGHDAFLLFNHGAITTGRDINEAFYRLETLEFCAEVLMKSECLGGPVRIVSSEVNKLFEVKDSLSLPNQC